LATAEFLDGDGTARPSPRSRLHGNLATRGDLQIIRAETQDWIECLDEVAAQGKIADPRSRVGEIDRAFGRAKVIIQRDIEEVDQLVERISQRLADDPILSEGIGDEITHALNSYARAKVEWAELLDMDPRGEAVLAPLEAIRDDLDEVVSRSGFLTIPNRLQDHLNSLRIGQGLDFNEVFKDELPSRPERLKVLRYLRDHPVAVSGVVDVEQGKVFKASRRSARRALSLLLIALAVAIDYGVFVAVANLVPEIDIPSAATDQQRLAILMKALTAALAGGAAHILVAAIKQSRSRQRGDAFLAIDDLVLWAHVREVQLVISGAFRSPVPLESMTSRERTTVTISTLGQTMTWFRETMGAMVLRAAWVPIFSLASPTTILSRAVTVRTLSRAMAASTRVKEMMATTP
jgi:hypothetical protein